MIAMLNLRKTILTGLAVVAIGAVWHSRIIAQENSSAGVVTVFDHDKLEASYMPKPSPMEEAISFGAERPAKGPITWMCTAESL